MRINFEVQNGICVLRLAGRFHTGSNADLVETRERLEQAGHRRVVVDCRDVPYIDTTGIAFVVGLFNAMRQAGGELTLTHVSDRIRKVLALTRLDAVIPIQESESAAEPREAQVCAAGR